MRTLLLLTLIVCSTLAGQQYQGYVEANGRFFDFLKGGGATVWLPVKGDQKQILFGQFNGGYYRKYLTKWSFGGGCRRLWTPRLGVGLNSFFDLGRSDAGHNYYQAGVGLEAFGPCWVLRTNGYITRKRASRIACQPVLLGTQVCPLSLFERVYTGLDAEAGYGVPLCSGEVWGYAGYYYYTTRAAPTIQGPRIRLEYTLYGGGTAGPEFTIGGEYRYDQVNKSEGALIARLRLPLASRRWKLNFRSCTPRIRRRMTDPVRRELNMWVQRLVQLDMNVANGGGAIAGLLFFADVGAPAAGTQSDPTTLADAVARSGINDILFILDSSGSVPGTFTLLDGQQFVGFGDGTSQMVTLPGGMMITINKTSAGGRGTLVPPSPIVLASGNIIKGVGVTPAAGVTGITGTSYGTLTIEDLSLTGFNTTGMSLTGSGDPTITDSTFTSTAAVIHILLSSGTGAVTLTDNTFTGAGGSNLPIFATPLSGSMTASGNAFAVPGGVSFSLSSGAGGSYTATFSSNTFTSSSISIQATNASTQTATFVITGNTFNGTGQTARITLSSGVSSGVTLNTAITGNTMTSTPASALPGIRFETDGGTINTRIEGANTISDHSHAVAFFEAGAASGTLTRRVLIDSLTATGVGSVVLVDNAGVTSIAGTDDITITGNAGTGVTGIAYNITTQSGGDTKTACYTISGNNSDGAGTQISVGSPSGGGAVSVFPSAVPATLSAANNGLTTSVGAGVTTAGAACPLPPAIP